MARSTAVSATTRLADIQRQFEIWRRTRSRGTPIPESLWQTAVALASSIGIHPVAKALRLDYYAVKRRVADRPSPAKASRAEFVEVEVGQASRSILAPEYLVEIERADGARMKVRVATDQSLNGLAETFLRGHS